MLDAVRGIRLVDLVDVGVVTLLLWTVILLLRRSRTSKALVGLGILIGIFLTARLVGLQLTVWMLQGFFAVLVIVVVVVFQEDLRQLFEQIANWGRTAPPARSSPGLVEVLVRTAARLSAIRTGALILVTGGTPLDRHARGGIPLDGKVSEPLLLSLFDPGSPGHDGGVEIRGDRVVRFAVHAPLSEDHAQIGERGTRHAAALGLAERTDALCIVVSEQTGVISTTHRGVLRRTAGAQELTGILRNFLAEADPPRSGGSRRWWRLRTRWAELAAAFVLSAALWLLLVGRE